MGAAQPHGQGIPAWHGPQAVCRLSSLVVCIICVLLLQGHSGSPSPYRCITLSSLSKNCCSKTFWLPPPKVATLLVICLLLLQDILGPPPLSVQHPGHPMRLAEALGKVQQSTAQSPSHAAPSAIAPSVFEEMQVSAFPCSLLLFSGLCFVCTCPGLSQVPPSNLKISSMEHQHG